MSSPEYQTFVKYRDHILSTISQDPQGITDILFSKFLISDNIREQVGLRHSTNREKARLIVDTLTTLLKQNSGHFDTFVSVLMTAGLWTGDLVRELKESRKKCEQKDHNNYYD